MHLERKAHQYAADIAALADDQSEEAACIYTARKDAANHEGADSAAAEAHLRDYAHATTRTEAFAVSAVTVDPDGTVRVVLTARTHPPLAGWFTRGTGTAIPLTVEGEARARWPPPCCSP